MRKQFFVLNFFITSIVFLQADDGVWINSSGDDWTAADATNWKATIPNAHPNGVDARAGFVGFPNAGGSQIITSKTTDITLGSLNLDIPPTVSSFKIDFSIGNHKLIFSSSNLVAELYINGSPIIDQGSVLTGTRITLDSDLDIFINAVGQPQITGSIDGSGALSLYGSNNANSADILTISGANSYTGGTFVQTGVLMIGGANDVKSIPQAALGNSLTVFQGGQVHHFHNNHYVQTASMNINGGNVNLSGTHQIMTQLSIVNGGSLADGGGGNLELLQTSPGFALIVGNDAMIGSSAAFSITLHGGGIQYDNNIPGTAFIAGPVTIDLGGTVDLNVPHNMFNCFDLDIGDTIFQNNTLNKTGDGVVRFQGGTVPIFNIQNGTVIIGDSPPASETVTATGLVTVSTDGTLGGFQTLDAQVGLVNSGTISPGSGCPCNSIGTLTINGDYAQTSTGTLLIKVSNSTAPGTASDLLVINNGNAHLNGALSIDTLPGGSLKVGDKILVLDNSTGSVPISGKFSSLISNLPPRLASSILQDPNRVFVLIGPCSSFCSPSLTNYINLSIPLFTLANAHSLQQRERILNLRQSLPCLSCNSVMYCPVESKVKQQKNLNKNTSKQNRVSYSNCCEDFETDKCRQEPCRPLTFYAVYLGSKGDVDRISIQPGYDFDSAGGLIGVNYAFNRGGLGVEAGYEQVDADVDAHWGDFDIGSVFASVYATYMPIPKKHLFFDVAFESKACWYQIHRHIDELTAKGKPHAWQWEGYIDAGYDLFWKQWYLTPLVSIEDIYLYIDDYTEHKAGKQNVHISHQNFHSLRSWLGMSFGGKFVHRCITWMPEIRGFWLHEFMDQDHKIKVTSPACNTSSHVRIFGGNNDFGVAGGKLRVLFGTHYSIAGSYDYYWNNSIQSHLFYVEFGVNW